MNSRPQPPWVAPLLDKYREMLRLRRGALDGTIVDPRPAMVALASRFPGALRGLDELPLGELERRLAYLEAGAQASVEPWAPVEMRYHELLRGALCAKKWLSGRPAADATEARFDQDAPSFCHAADALAWRDALASLASPPQGRVTGLVLARITAEMGLDMAEVDRLLFGFGGRYARRTAAG